MMKFQTKIQTRKYLNTLKRTVKNVLILDGLQRTYTLIDAGNEISDEKREEFFEL